MDLCQCGPADTYEEDAPGDYPVSISEHMMAAVYANTPQRTAELAEIEEGSSEKAPPAPNGNWKIGACLVVALVGAVAAAAVVVTGSTSSSGGGGAVSTTSPSPAPAPVVVSSSMARGGDVSADDFDDSATVAVFTAAVASSTTPITRKTTALRRTTPQSTGAGRASTRVAAPTCTT